MSTKTSQIYKSNLIWQALSYFLANPSSEVYVKELARKLRVGPTGLNNVLKKLSGTGFLRKKIRARSHFHSLNNESPVVRQLKTAFFLARAEDARLVDKFLEADEGMISLCLYGSFADGTFDEKSDIDLLIISQKGGMDLSPAISKFEKILGQEVNAEVFTLSNWKKVRTDDTGFYREVMASHILLYGSELL